jgi:hypothetical protein
MHVVLLIVRLAAHWPLYIIPLTVLAAALLHLPAGLHVQV